LRKLSFELTCLRKQAYILKLKDDLRGYKLELFELYMDAYEDHVSQFVVENENQYLIEKIA